MDAVRAELRRRRLPIYLFAQRIGLSESRLRRLLAGRTTPRPGELRLISKRLGLTVGDLIGSSRDGECSDASGEAVQ